MAIHSTGQFLADVCGPNCLVNNVWSFLQTHVFVHAVLGHVAVVKHDACESDTERRLHFRIAKHRSEHSLVVALLLQRTQRFFCVSRNSRPGQCRRLSSLVTRRATSCASSSNILNVCLLLIFLGESSVFQHRVWKKRRGMC